MSSSNMAPTGRPVNQPPTQPELPPVGGDSDTLRYRIAAAETRVQRTRSLFFAAESERNQLATDNRLLRQRIADLERQLGHAADRVHEAEKQQRASVRVAEMFADQVAAFRAAGIKPGRVITKVRWWSDAWDYGAAASQNRYYGPGRQKWALRQAEKMRARGHQVEVHQAPVGTFELIEYDR